MKSKKPLLLAFLAPFFTLPALADNPVEVNGLYYNLVEEGKTATVTKNEKQGIDDEGNAYTYSDYSGSVIIPSTITIEESGTTYSVVGIEDEAFIHSSVTSVVIPNSVTTIGKLAFWVSDEMKFVTIPNSVTFIGDGAFSACSSLTSVAIPESVTRIPGDCFSSCISLTSVSIPNSVTSIGGLAFYDCRSLASITIPESVTDIGEYAFSYCGFTSVTIPNSVTTIGGRAFHNCGSLTSIFISESVTNIESEAFSPCLNLTSIIVDEKNSFYDSRNSCNAIIETASNTLIQGCSTTIIPSSVTHIGGYAFTGCNITSIFIPESVISIGWGAFQFCTNLASVNIPESITELGACAFGRTALTSITIPSSVTFIGQGLVSGFNLTSIVVDKDNKVYDSRENCNGIIETSTGTLIQGCQTTLIPNSVTNIGEAAFWECGCPVSVTIPESVTSIGNGAFFRCGSMATVTIPNSVTSIGDGAFNECDFLTSVVSLIQEPFSFGENTFTGISEDCVLTVPFGTKEAYIAAGWTEEVFKGGIVEADPVPVTVPVTLGDAGVATFCCEEALDFSGTEDVKAYIVSAFRPSTGNVTLTRITDVPAGTGIVLLGNAGTYDIPLGAGETIVSNLLVGVTSSKTLNKVEGANTNFILADGENGIGFYTVVDGSTLAAGKAYLPLPTAALPSNAQSIGLRFDGTTGIRSLDNGQMMMDNDEWLTIDGRRLDVEPTTKGLYIVNGRKVIVK